MNEYARKFFGAPVDAWIGTGVRAADSPMRRLAISRHGPVHARRRTYLPVWDWSVADVEAIIRKHGIKLPPEYRVYGRTYDGIDARFLGPMREMFPDDYERVLQWFPLADLELFREQMILGKK